MEFSLKELAEILDASFMGDGDKVISGVAPLEVCGPDQISYAAGEKWLKKLKKSRAGAVVASEDPGIDGLNCILHSQPQLAIITIIKLFHPEERNYNGISSKADIAASVDIAEPVSVGPFVSVGEGTTIGPRAVISPGVVIGKNVVIGSDCTLHSNVVIEDRCMLGDRVIIHAGSIIGADGFGYMQHEGESRKVPQVGGVRIGDDVEMGANVCVDRGTLGDTIIGSGVKVDNLVQIAHNVVVGDNAVIVAQVGLAGSATIGRGAVLAGQSGVTEHVETGDGVMVAAQSLVTKNVKAGTVVAGTPAYEIEIWRKSRVIERTIPKYWSRIVELLKEWEKEKG